MVDITTERIRNVVLLSHSGAGKTILSEAILHQAGVTTRLGRVEDGTTASDFEPEETKRQTSVQTAVLNTPWREHKLNILDTPGYADFRGEVVSGVRVADAAGLAHAEKVLALKADQITTDDADGLFAAFYMTEPSVYAGLAARP